MQNSRLIALLNTLSKPEVRELRKFLASPFFNRREDVPRLFGYLAGRSGRPPEKEQAFAHVYPGQPYNDQQMRYLMSWLLQAIEQYLALQPLLQDPSRQQAALAQAYRQRGLGKHFEQSLRGLQQRQEAQPLRNAEYYEMQYQILAEQYQYTAVQARLSEHNLQEVSDSIDLAFIARKLRQACLLRSHQAVYQREYDFGMLEAVLRHVQERGLLEVPAVAIYFHCYLALSRQEADEHFLVFRDLLLQQSGCFPVQEARDLYLLGLNYCIRRLNAGEERFAREGLTLCQHGLASGQLAPEGAISRFTYRNAVAMALKEGELDWAEQFIHSYKEYLPLAHQESMYSFSLARLAYERRNYGQVLELLQKSEYEDLLLNLAAKTLLLKTYYELGEADVLESHLEAMQAFLRRKDIIGYHRRNYRAIIRFAQKLLRLGPYDRAAALRLRQQIEAESALTEKAWLLRQIKG
jgi:hypothetical protein